MALQPVFRRSLNLLQPTVLTRLYHKNVRYIIFIKAVVLNTFNVYTEIQYIYISAASITLIPHKKLFEP